MPAPFLRPNGQIQAKFGSILAKKGNFLNFPEKSKPSFFFDSRDQASCKKLGNSNAQFSKKMRKTPIFGHFGPKRPILDQKGPKRGHFRIFGEKAKTSLFYSFFFIFQYKKSENSNARIFRKIGTYGRTDVGESKGPSTTVERPKKRVYQKWTKSN